MKYLFGLQWNEKPTKCALKLRTVWAKAKITSHADDCCVCSLNLPLAQWDSQATTAQSNEGKHDCHTLEYKPNWEIYRGMNIFLYTFHIIKVIALHQKCLRLANLRDGLLNMISS